MIRAILKSTEFCVAACALCIGGLVATPFAVYRDCEEGDNDFPRGWCAAAAAGLGVIGEYAAIIALCI